MCIYPFNFPFIEFLFIDANIVTIDAPWCSITSTAASHKYLSDFKGGIEKSKKFSEDPSMGVKGRNEPGDVSFPYP